jgi:dynein heavy chain
MDQAKEIQKTYDALMAAMAEYQGKQVSAWCERVAATSDEKLNQPLLTVTPHGTLGVNFDPELVRLLRETKYFLLLKVGGGSGQSSCHV